MAHPGDVVIEPHRSASTSGLDLSAMSGANRNDVTHQASPSAPPELSDDGAIGSLPGSIMASSPGVEPTQAVATAVSMQNGIHSLPDSLEMQEDPSRPGPDLAILSSISDSSPPNLQPPHPQQQMPEVQSLQHQQRPFRNTVHPLTTPATVDNTGLQASDSTNDLVNMLECPICFDTADSPPIYQCPEGHLLCQECNSRLVDCPQCGHALMNSRNRTAEELAERLQSLRGTSSTGDSSSPETKSPMNISVSGPRKVRKGLFSHVVYQLDTEVKPADSNQVTKHRVSRRYSEVVSLHEKLIRTYQHTGVIVPPPPEKSGLATVAVKVAAVGNSDLNDTIYSKRCLALDRYMKRLAKHPTIRRDTTFRGFVQDKDLPAELREPRTVGDKMGDIQVKLGLFRANFSITEHDAWFQTRRAQLKSLAKQLREIRTNLKDMSHLKLRLFDSTTAFQKALLSMLINRASRDRSNLDQILNDVIDCHKTMGIIHQEQSKADDLIIQLAVDYERLVSTAKLVLSHRKLHQMNVQKAQKGNKNPLEEVERLQKDFDKISQTIRRELEHFDYVMKGEFEEAFKAYKASYWKTLSTNARHDVY